ncbi:response regulator [Flavihumibacter petaseus]|uniref:Putative two-component response regulator n=1 Tax=Flavihumibacter petaseus NBRC 106054 TaxID=1220578 RepID=A0A0E9N5T2_9BACT|nr:response regulator [Flavihumibacter petaseus]GAO45163.1 putative two-component response regulator [Flavihumibacter petaseus NBRC 106054]
MVFQKILIVDDDMDDFEILRGALESIPAAPTIGYAENGEKALDTLNRYGQSDNLPELIVLDLNMPLKNGTETLRSLKADPRFRHIPVIIYSTSINPLEANKCMQLGALSYITKPISHEESVETAKLFQSICEKR